MPKAAEIAAQVSHGQGLVGPALVPVSAAGLPLSCGRQCCMGVSGSVAASKAAEVAALLCVAAELQVTCACRSCRRPRVLLGVSGSVAAIEAAAAAALLCVAAEL